MLLKNIPPLNLPFHNFPMVMNEVPIINICLSMSMSTPFPQIKAYLQCSKLRSAYLQAVKLEASRAGPLVQEVLQASEGAGDSVMQGICRQWLSEHQDKTAKQRPSRPNAR